MKSLNTQDLAAIGGGTLVTIVDGACAVAGVAGLLTVAVFPYALGACALWGLGRFITA